MKGFFVMCVLIWLVVAAAGQKLVFSDEFNALDLKVWCAESSNVVNPVVLTSNRNHEITMGGGGNGEFEYYANNRSNSYVRDGILYIKPTLTADSIGAANLQDGFTLDLWGAQYRAVCTGNAFYGCERTSGGGRIINPIQSARMRTAESFSFKYGKVEIRAKLPRGDWLWPALWLLPTCTIRLGVSSSSSMCS
jgi:hypothetical protein